MEQATKLLNEIKEFGGKVRTHPITLENINTPRLRYNGRSNWTSSGQNILIIYTDETTDEIIEHLTTFRDELAIQNRKLNNPSEIINQINKIFN